MAAELRDALQDLQSHTNSCKVTKLNDENYTRWKKEMMMYLKSANVMNPPLPVPEPLMLLLVVYLALSLELD